MPECVSARVCAGERLHLVTRRRTFLLLLHASVEVGVCAYFAAGSSAHGPQRRERNVFWHLSLSPILLTTHAAVMFVCLFVFARRCQTCPPPRSLPH